MIKFTKKRPLFRWTLGKVYHLGYEIMLESIRLARLHWGEMVDYIVVCNNIPRNWEDDLSRRGINWVYADVRSLPFPARGFGWKYYPPRLRLDSHELFIDNDLIFLKRSGYIDEFLRSDSTLYNEDIGRGFAEFEGLIQREASWHKLGANGGLFGFPPGYDIRSKLLGICGGWRHYLSEQGLTAYLTLTYPQRIGIPMPLVYNHNFKDSRLGTYGGIYSNKLDAYLMSSLDGIHFIGANRGYHPTWEFYKRHYPQGAIKLI